MSSGRVVQKDAEGTRDKAIRIAYETRRAFDEECGHHTSWGAYFSQIVETDEDAASLLSAIRDLSIWRDLIKVLALRAAAKKPDRLCGACKQKVKWYPFQEPEPEKPLSLQIRADLSRGGIVTNAVADVRGPILDQLGAGCY